MSRVAPPPLLIDTDGGVDDCLAVVVAMRMAPAAIRGITACGGNTSVAKALRNVVLAACAGNPERFASVRFGAGEERTLTGEPFLTIGHSYHSEEGLPLPSDRLLRTPFVRVTTAEAVFRELGRSSGLAVACLGPLSNLASFVLRNGSAPDRIEQVVVMGGCFDGRGSVPVVHDGRVVRLADFNFYSDPLAARVVLERFGTRATLVPKEVCDQVRLDAIEIAQLADERSFERLVLREWLRFRESQPGKSTSLTLNDPLATVIAGRQCACETEEVRVEVVTDGIERGVTRISRCGTPVRVVRKIDPAAAKRIISEHLFPS